ncbi:MAG: peptidylprolyl isomerase [Frankiaceae bacterium]|nr:peptidylprolyl isomerase [Frankiaceae bacterium]
MIGDVSADREKTPVRRTIAVVAAALVLTGCASSKGSTASSAPSTSGSATSSAAANGPFSASGTYGHEPTITFPAGSTAPTTLVKTTVTEGTGPAVNKGDLLVAHYVGQVWGAAQPFDSSYKNNAPATFLIGVGKVVPGWDAALVGVKTGSRVLLSLPPAQGYGTAGNTTAGIKGTDTIVFVVDVIASYLPTLGGQADAAPQQAVTPGITITGALGKKPTLKVAKGTAEPKKASATVLAKGTGEALADGITIVQIESVDWSNAPAGSTWTSDGLQSLTIGTGGPLDVLKGTPIGSRILLQLPKDTSTASAHPALAAVIDIVAQPKMPA